MTENPKRILIVNVNWVGDIIFSTPFIKALRDAEPGSHIACLLHPRCKDMLEGDPRIDEVILYDEEGIHKSLIGKARLVRELRRKHFDTSYILHRSFTKALLTWLAGIKHRIGYATKGRGFLLTTALKEPVESIHKVEYFLALAHSQGIKVTDVSYEFFVGAADRMFVKELLAELGVSESDRLVVICPGGNWDPKRWPAENFAKLSDLLIEKFKVKVVAAGGLKDIKLAEGIQKKMRFPLAIASGKTDLKQLGALLERAQLVIANDTGPMHIGVAMKTKVIALFGPTSPKLTGPYGRGDYHVISKVRECNIPCYDKTCTYNSCMAEISVEDVFKEAEELLSLEK
ncbi:MAG: lipopolysaccharide heptosyltransferase II [Candidatus Omnitrophota bacterium]|jgi:lipopolysaccharide heptosyltransferase II